MTADRAHDVLLDRVREVENCRSYGAGPGPDQHGKFADHYLRWVEDTELHFRNTFQDDDWLAGLHTERWRQIVNLDSGTRRPAALVNAEIDHQASRLRAIAQAMRTGSVSSNGPRRDRLGDYAHRLTDLHPRIVDASVMLFLDGHYVEAILRAFITVEAAVREKSGVDRSGVALMNQVMGTPAPVLRMTTKEGQAGRDEQDGWRYLFAGALQGIRNPKAHGLVVQDNPGRTFECLSLASLLMRRLDDAEVIREV